MSNGKTVHFINLDFPADPFEQVRIQVERLGFHTAYAVDPDSFVQDSSMLTDEGCLFVGLINPEVGFGYQARLADQGVLHPLVFVKLDADARFAVRAGQLGAFGIVDKTTTNDQLARLLDDCFEITKSLQHAREAHQYRLRLDSLSEREQQIVRMAADGLPNKKIASILGLSVKTVEKQRRNAYLLLDVKSTAQMARAVTLGGLHRVIAGPNIRMVNYLQANDIAVES